MLFYLKKHPLLELLVSAVLVLLAWAGMEVFRVSPPIEPSLRGVAAGVVGAGLITLWTLGVHRGYALVKGREHADALRRSLARHFSAATPLQILLAFVAAGCEELFFRGFVQERFGLLAGAVLFMLAHIGGRDIRVIGYWSFFHGLGFGLVSLQAGNLVAPIVAHGLFDVGAMVHFRALMREPRPG